MVRLKHLAKLYAGGTPDRANSQYWEGGKIPWLNSGAVNQWVVNRPSSYITEEGFRNSSAKWVPKGALVMALAGQGKTKGMAAELAIDSTCNQSLAAIVPRVDLTSRFLLWWLTANYETIRNLAGNELRDGLNLDMIGDIPCPCPSTDTSWDIANYLDDETARIDALIAAKRQALALLEDRRAHSIALEVLGFTSRDPSISVQDWMSALPAKWQITTLGRCLIRVTYGFTNPMPTVDEGPYLLTANDIGDGIIKYSTARRTSEEAYLTAITDKSRPRAGDVLVTKDGTLGRVALADGERACINQSVALLRPSAVLDPTYLTVLLRSTPYQQLMAFQAGGTTIKHIYISRIVKMPIPVPPLEDQRYITSIAQEIDAYHDSATESLERSIELLQEHRRTLIATAVTGQLDISESV